MSSVTDSPRLDPVGRARLPRRTTTARLVVVAVLLLTAAGVLASGDRATTAPARGSTAGSSQDAPSPAEPVWPPGRDPGNLGTPGGPPPREGPADPDHRPVPEGMVGVAVSPVDPVSLTVLRPGDQVDLHQGSDPPGDQPGWALMVAGATVLAVDRAGPAVLLSLTEEQAQTVLSAPPGSRYSIVVRS